MAAHYPECDSFECPECPRRGVCADFELPDEALFPGSPSEAFVDYIEDRISEIEVKVAHLYETEERMMRILAAIQKCQEEL